MKNPLSHRGSHAGSDQSLERFSEVLRLGSFWTVYFSYFVYQERIAMLQCLKTWEDGLSPLSQRESFDDVEDLVNSEEDTDRDPQKCSEAADLAMRLLT